MIDYLITGGEGFIGKNLAYCLKRDKKSFEIIDKCSSGEFYCITRDVSEEKFYLNAPYILADTMIHLAAFTNVRDSVRNPIKCFMDNCLGTINCLELAKDLKINRFIFASSIGAPLSQSPYSASKLAGEAACKAYRESYGLDISIIRFSNVYGPHSLHKYSVIPRFIKSILKREPLQVFGDGEQTRDFIFVDDVVSALTAIGPMSDISASLGRSITINNLISILSDLSTRTTDYVPEIQYLPPKKGEVLKIECKSDIKPLTKLEEGLERTFEWFRDNYSG